MRSIGPKIQRNRGPCSVARCTRMREGLGRYCKGHRDARRRYGHPEGRRVCRKEFVQERLDVARLFKGNPEHEGVANAGIWLQAWIDAAGHGDRTVPGHLDLSRLYRHGVGATDALIELCALWLYFERRRLPDDERLTVALARGLMYLAPRDALKTYACRNRKSQFYRKPTREALADIGNHARLHLALLFVNVVQAIREHEVAERDARTALGAPFTNAPFRKRQRKARAP